MKNKYEAIILMDLDCTQENIDAAIACFSPYTPSTLKHQLIRNVPLAYSINGKLIMNFLVIQITTEETKIPASKIRLLDVESVHRFRIYKVEHFVPFSAMQSWYNKDNKEEDR